MSFIYFMLSLSVFMMSYLMTTTLIHLIPTIPENLWVFSHPTFLFFATAYITCCGAMIAGKYAKK